MDNIIDGMMAASDAIFNQEQTMRDERAEAHVRICKLKETITGRILERCALAHKTAESSSALEPGWDVVN